MLRNLKVFVSTFRKHLLSLFLCDIIVTSVALVPPPACQTHFSQYHGDIWNFGIFNFPPFIRIKHMVCHSKCFANALSLSFRHFQTKIPWSPFTCVQCMHVIEYILVVMITINFALLSSVLVYSYSWTSFRSFYNSIALAVFLLLSLSTSLLLLLRLLFYSPTPSVTWK